MSVSPDAWVSLGAVLTAAMELERNSEMVARCRRHFAPSQFGEKLSCRPSAPKGAIDFGRLTARLKAVPRYEAEFFSKLLSRIRQGCAGLAGGEGFYFRAT